MPALKGRHDAIEIIKVDKHTKVTDSQASKYLCCQHILSEITQIRLAMFCYGSLGQCDDRIVLWRGVERTPTPQLVYALGIKGLGLVTNCEPIMSSF